jgi:cobalt-zinc-cadmium resistance protein CzcA
MAWTVAFALLGAIIFAMLLAPVLASYFFRGETREWRNPVLEFITRAYRRTIEWTLQHRGLTLSGGVAIVAATFGLVASGLIGSEFLPHLDEGAIWARGTLAPSTGPSEGVRIMNQARLAFSEFPEVTKVVSQVGRPDDGTDATGFFNTEYFIDLKGHDQWRKQFHKDKELLIASLDAEVEKIPGVIWNFSQPISDNMEEAVSGVKGELAVKIMGDDLKTLETKADEIVNVMQPIPGVADLGVFHVLGQPNLNLIVDRAKADRYGINVSDIQDAIETAVGGKAVSEILIGEEHYDLVVRYQAHYRTTIDDIANIRILAPSGERVSLGQLCDIQIEDGASMIYRENNSRYIAIKYSVRGRDLGSTVRDAIHDVGQKVTLPTGYTLQWAGEYASQQRANARMALIVPITVLLIILLLYTAFGSFNWSLLIMATLATAPIGGMLALLVTGTHFSVSSGIGMLALFGVSVQVGLIMIQYINQARVSEPDIHKATVEGAVRSLRPTLMVMLVATLGLLPAALSHDIGSDSQRPFAIVIVGGLTTDLFLSVILLPTLYALIARPGDRIDDK